MSLWGPLEMNRSVSRLLIQLLDPVLQLNTRPRSLGNIAFSQDFLGYVTPLVSSGRLRQVEHQRSKLIKGPPAWFSQPWWPQILFLMVEFPHLIPSQPYIMIPTFLTMANLFKNPAQIVAWKLSRNRAEQISFQSHLQDCFSHL